MQYTSEQLEAIDQIRGNLQIIACAGSGKTQTISARIANMVVSGIPKENILAFTFTKKAANEMKLRIRSQLEEKLPENSELGGMYIGTIHSFCFQYIKEIKPEYRNYDIIDDNKQLLFLTRHSNDIGFHLLRRVGEPPFKPIKKFLNTINIIKQNQIPLVDVEKENPNFCYIYNNYLSKMEEHKFIDFPTIIELLVNILESETNQLKTIRDKIKYIVVDEYQDINFIQEKLIKLIAGSDGNLCVVGDDDQSIFEFQGANVNNILTFTERYDNVKEIALLKNFRSTNTIIESARDLIQYNQGNRLEKRMIHGKSYKVGEPGDIYQLEFADRREEVEYIADKILELRGYKYLEFKDEETGEEHFRGLDWCDFAILVRNNKTARDFIDIFEDRGIHYTTKGTAGLFQRPQIRFIQMVFNYFCDENIWSKEGNILCQIDDLENYYKENIDIGRWETNKQALENIKIEICEGKRFYPQTIFHRILNAMGMADGLFDEGQLFDFGRFSQLILDFETVNEWVNISRLKSFIFFLNGYASEKIDIGGLDDPTKLNTVTIQSVHKSKGLEYPVVFIPDMRTMSFPSNMRNTKPDVFLSNRFHLSQFTSGDIGERRLFYVGITRSEKFLFLTMSRDVGHKKQYRHSCFFDEFYHDIMIKKNIEDPTKRDKIAASPKNIFDVIPTTYTDLQYYLQCPYDYLLRKLMGFSPTIDLSFGYGLQIHNLLNRIHTEFESVIPSESDIEKMTEEEFFLRYTRGDIFENMKNKTKDIIKHYISSYSSDLPLKLETEKPFEFVLDDALISGQIDLITKINPDTKEVLDVNLIDFKTEKKEGRSERTPYNRLQLRLYAIAVGKSFGLNPEKSNIHYLSDNVRLEVDVSEDKLKDARETINNSIQGIKNRDFHCNSGLHCKNCDFNTICPK